MYETVDSTATKEELTLEALNDRIESLTDAINHMYDAFRKSVEQKFMYEDHVTKIREQNTAQAFYNTSMSVTALNAKIENLAEFLVDKGLDREAFNKKSLADAQALIDEQDKAVREHFEKQEAEAKAKQSNLTEAGE